MKRFFKNVLFGTALSYLVLGVCNLIRFVIFHYCYNVPAIVEYTQNESIREYDSLYLLGSQYYHLGYMENSIEIQICLFVFSILIGVIYSIVRYNKNK